MNITPARPSLAIALAASALLLHGCGDGSDDGIGGGAGDGNVSPIVADDIARLAPLSGLYLLAENWRGGSGDLAYLIIEAPDADGTSRVRLADVDEIDNCAETERLGELRVDRAGAAPALFLDDLPDFESGIVADASGGLTIVHADVNDRDGDQDRDEFVVTAASSVAADEADVLPPSCR